MCTEEFIRMMFTVDLYGNRGLDSRKETGVERYKIYILHHISLMKNFYTPFWVCC